MPSLPGAQLFSIVPPPPQCGNSRLKLWPGLARDAGKGGKREQREGKGGEKRAGNMGSEEPACQAGTGCQLQQEISLAWMLLREKCRWEGGQYGGDSYTFICMFAFPAIHPRQQKNANVERQVLIERHAKC